jgi:protein SCO1/2
MNANHRPTTFQNLRRIAPALLLLATAILLLTTACDQDGALRDFEIDSNISLTDHDGRPFELRDLDNKTVLLYFGFTHCPDFCPATLSKLRRVYRILGNRSRHLQTVLVTVDPERDTPERLKSYVEYFEIDAIGLSGTPAEIAATAKRFGAHYERQSLNPAEAANQAAAAAQIDGASPAKDAAYTVDHSTGLFLIDSQGRVRHVFKHGDTPQQIAETLQLILPFF